MTPDEMRTDPHIREAIRRSVDQAPPLPPAAVDLLRRLGCPVPNKKKSAHAGASRRGA